MELFNRRYLCFIAFVFLFSAFLCCFVSGIVKIIIASISFVLLSVFIFAFFKAKKSKFYILFTTLLCASIFVSSLSSYIFITRAEQEADSLVGKNVVMIRILSREDDDSYDARLLRVGDHEVDVRAKLVIDIEEDLEYGDELIIRARIKRDSDVFDRSRLLSVLADVDDVGAYLNRAEEKDYFSWV